MARDLAFIHAPGAAVEAAFVVNGVDARVAAFMLIVGRRRLVAKCYGAAKSAYRRRQRDRHCCST